MRLDPFPRLTEVVGEHLTKPRLLILTVILTKICLDRVYQYAKVICGDVMICKELLLTVFALCRLLTLTQS